MGLRDKPEVKKEYDSLSQAIKRAKSEEDKEYYRNKRENLLNN